MWNFDSAFILVKPIRTRAGNEVAACSGDDNAAVRGPRNRTSE